MAGLEEARQGWRKRKGTLGPEESERGAARDGQGGGSTALLGSSSCTGGRKGGERGGGDKAEGEAADKDARGARIAGVWREDGRRRRRVRRAEQNREEEEKKRLTGGPGEEKVISLFFSFLGCDR